mmetsp:Transcript_8446/g.24215  ORF Transcript_8446/g.24215 Transcript_8446/m.24215 type:complete len:304 (+) Transcript_8446:86-997(+)
MTDLHSISVASLGLKRALRKSRVVDRVHSSGFDEYVDLAERRRLRATGSQGVFDESPGAFDLFKAVEEDSLLGIDASIRDGVNVDARSGKQGEFSGQTALVLAVRLGRLRCVQLLLDYGADPFIPDEKFRDAWYYCAFGRNIENGEHESFIKFLLEKWPPDATVMLVAAHSAHPGVRRAVLDALPLEITSRDSKNYCKLRFGNLGFLDDPAGKITWPDGSISKDGMTAYHQLVTSEAVDAVSHPSMQALLNIKWKRFAHACFIQDLFTYLMTLASISWVGVLFPGRNDGDVNLSPIPGALPLS